MGERGDILESKTGEYPVIPLVLHVQKNQLVKVEKTLCFLIRKLGCEVAALMKNIMILLKRYEYLVTGFVEANERSRSSE